MPQVESLSFQHACMLGSCLMLGCQAPAKRPLHQQQRLHQRLHRQERSCWVCWGCALKARWGPQQRPKAVALARNQASLPHAVQAVVSQVARHFAFLGMPQPQAGSGGRAAISHVATRPLLQPEPPPLLHRPAPLLGGALAASPPPPSPPLPPAQAPSPNPGDTPASVFSVLGMATVPAPPRLRTRITPVLPLDLQFPPTALPEPPVPLVDVAGSGACLEASSVVQQGAAGDGKRDNAAALRSADARPGPPVLYFPPGTYRVAANLTLTKAVVMGEGGGGRAVW